jgi:hypothetical protein
MTMQTKNWMTAIGAVAGLSTILVGGVAANAQKPSKNDQISKFKDVKHAQHGYKVKEDLGIKHFNSAENDKIGNEKKAYHSQMGSITSQADAWKRQGHGKLTGQEVDTLDQEKKDAHINEGKYIDKRKVDEANNRYTKISQYKNKREDLKTDYHNYKKHGDAPRDTNPHP